MNTRGYLLSGFLDNIYKYPGSNPSALITSLFISALAQSKILFINEIPVNYKIRDSFVCCRGISLIFLPHNCRCDNIRK